jgi:hypothetical protein
MKVNGQDLNVANGFWGDQKDKKVGNKYIKVKNIDINQALPDEFALDLTIQEKPPSNGKE